MYRKRFALGIAALFSIVGCNQTIEAPDQDKALATQNLERCSYQSAVYFTKPGTFTDGDIFPDLSATCVISNKNANKYSLTLRLDRKDRGVWTDARTVNYPSRVETDGSISWKHVKDAKIFCVPVTDGYAYRAVAVIRSYYNSTNTQAQITRYFGPEKYVPNGACTKPPIQ